MPPSWRSSWWPSQAGRAGRSHAPRPAPLGPCLPESPRLPAREPGPGASPASDPRPTSTRRGAPERSRPSGRPSAPSVVTGVPATGDSLGDLLLGLLELLLEVLVALLGLIDLRGVRVDRRRHPAVTVGAVGDALDAVLVDRGRRNGDGRLGYGGVVHLVAHVTGGSAERTGALVGVLLDSLG